MVPIMDFSPSSGGFIKSIIFICNIDKLYSDEFIEGYSYGILNRNNSKTSELLRNQAVVNSAALAGERSVVDSPSSHSLISLNEHVGTLEESTLTADKLAYKNGKSEGIKEELNQ